MSELSSDARSLVEAGRMADAPSAADKARLKNRLALQLGASVFASSALAAGLMGTAEPTLSASGRLASGLAGRGMFKLLAAAGPLAALLGGLAWFGNTAQVQRREQPAVQAVPRAPAQEQPVQPALVVPEPLSPPAALAPESAQTRPAARTRHKPALTASSHDTLSAELALLARAQQALRTGAPADALSIASEHARHFPAGALQEERAGIEALAHCMLGQPKHAAVARFLAAHPRSPVAARVRKECGQP